MPRLEWNASGTRFYEAGVDRGVLFVGDGPGVAWNGLTSVNESPSGGDPTPFYIDGYKYLNQASGEEFEGTITAFTYPDEFEVCDGADEPRSGLLVMQQPRKSFSFSYRTMIGNDQSESFGYKIHIIYNALASPTERSNNSFSDTVDPGDMSWKITTKPLNASGYRPFSHIVIDSRTTDSSIMSLIEDTLYGDEAESPRLPSFDEVLGYYDTISTLTIVDNGDGTWTATAPFDVIRMLDDTTFEITAATAVFIDDVSYTISSA